MWSGNQSSNPYRRSSMRRLVTITLAVAPVGLLAGCGDDEWTPTEIGIVEVVGERLIVGPHCNEDARVTADEAESEIRVSFEVKGDSQGECYGVAEVTLSEPIGDRTVIDVATDQPAQLGTHS